jgi:hypothetical protein
MDGLGLLALLTLPWGWAILACVVFLVWCMETESPFLATLCAVGTSCALQWGLGVPLWDGVRANPLVALLWLLAYLGIGAAWSVVKWWLYCLGQKRQYLKDQEAGKKYSDAERPKASRHRSHIYLWIGYWPVSMVWTLIDDPVRRVINAIVDWLKGLYQKISDSVWADVKDDK